MLLLLISAGLSVHLAAARAGETLIDTLCNQYSPELRSKVHEDFTKTETAPFAEKAPTRAFSWLKADIQLSRSRNF